MNLNDIPDSVLAAMIRNGCYARNTTFGTSKYDAKYLLVLAVPYGPCDDVTDLAGAFESFRELLTADDWEERNFQVLEAPNGYPIVHEVAPESLPVETNTDDGDISVTEVTGEDWVLGNAR